MLLETKVVLIAKIEKSLKPCLCSETSMISLPQLSARFGNLFPSRRPGLDLGQSFPVSWPLGWFESSIYCFSRCTVLVSHDQTSKYKSHIIIYKGTIFLVSLTFCWSLSDEHTAQISYVQSWQCPVVLLQGWGQVIGGIWSEKWNLKSDFSDGLSPIQLVQGQPKKFTLDCMDKMGIVEMEVECP